MSVSGLRGVVGEQLTPLVVARFLSAFAAGLPPGPIVLARDGRTTGPMLADVARGALAAMGRTVLDAGIVATPTVGVLVQAQQAAGGVQISASHNPLPYNGLKLFGGDGRVLSAGIGRKVIDRYRTGESSWSAFDRIGSVTPLADVASEHLRRVLATVDVGAIRARKYRVVLDSNAGSGSVLGLPLLQALACEVIAVGSTPDGRFLHPPEPTRDNLRDIFSQTESNSAAAGFCQDPDADRLALIDENGRYIGEEYTLAICLNHILRHRRGPVVANCATSRMAADIAAQHGVPFIRSAVGEANVVDAMLREGAVFGGEGNGGPIDPQVVLVRDSFVGMALVLAAMTARNLPLSALADELPRYEIRKQAVPFAGGDLRGAFQRLERQFPAAAADWLDGLRLDWPDRWLIVRGSNTEPILRIIAEAPTASAADDLCAQAAAVLAN